MTKTQIYFEESELRALHALAKRKKKSVAHLVREAVRTAWLKTENCGPVALWDGEPRRPAAEHDSIYDQQ